MANFYGYIKWDEIQIFAQSRVHWLLALALQAVYCFESPGIPCAIFLLLRVYNEKSILILLQNDSHSCLTPLQLLQQQIQVSAAVSNGHSNMNNSLNGLFLHNSQSSGKHCLFNLFCSRVDEMFQCCWEESSKLLLFFQYQR